MLPIKLGLFVSLTSCLGIFAAEMAPVEGVVTNRAPLQSRPFLDLPLGFIAPRVEGTVRLEADAAGA